MASLRVENLDIPVAYKKLLIEDKYKYLFPPQELAVKAGLLNRKNIVVSAPTASGKTLIAELAIVKNIIEHKTKALYLTPLRALASEKYEEFKRLSKIGIKVALSTGDYDSSDPWLVNYDIIITTNEKADSLLRHNAPWVKDLGIIVADEIHLINDAKRGPTLEVLMARFLSLDIRPQIIALSATINNAKLIAKWLGAKLVKSNWRPVPLKEGVFYDGVIEFNNEEIKEIKSYSRPLIALVRDSLKDKGQVLIFTSTRQSSVRLAQKLSKETYRLLNKNEKDELEDIADKILHTEKNRITEKLADDIRHGVAFHHAGLSYFSRKVIEDTFRNNVLKVICATPTLAAGVNLPARRVIIHSYKRYNGELGMFEEIPVLEYKQMSGRAGRPKYDKYGEAILIASTQREKDSLLENYIYSKPENIVSKLSAEPSLRTHLLAIIASKDKISLDKIFKFLSKTFYAYQYPISAIKYNVNRVLLFLRRKGFIDERDGVVSANEIGKRVAELYIDPYTAGIIIDGLKIIKTDIKDFYYLQLISQTPDMPTLYLRRGERKKLEKWIEENFNKLLIKPPLEPEERDLFLAKLKTALLLYDWTNEVSEDTLIEKYDVGPGDIYSIVQSGEWLLYSSYELAKILGDPRHLRKLFILKERVKGGVKEELLELIQIKGIGRVRARILYNNGIKGLKDLLSTPEPKLLAIPLIGREIINRIKGLSDNVESAELDKHPKKKKGTLEDFL